MEQAEERFDSIIAGIYYVALALLLASIPLSKYTTSVSQFVVLGFWLLYRSDTEYFKTYYAGNRLHPGRILRLVTGFFVSLAGSLLSKFKSFFSNKVALVISSLLLLHVLGLLYTTDFQYGLKDIRTKLPLFLLPLFLSTGPRINTRVLYALLLAYSLAILGGTIYRLILYYNLPVADTRALNAHISHIRFSLNAVFSTFVLLYLMNKKSGFPVWAKGLFGLTAAWFLFFLFFQQYTTGIAIFILVTIIMLLFRAFRAARAKMRVVLLLACILLAAAPILYFSSVVREFRKTEPISFNTLEPKTVQGNSYYHDTVNFRIENGHYVGLYICDKELRKAWAGRSHYPIDSLDQKQQNLRFTLIRYMASKQLRKDSSGLAQLSDADIRNIEAGRTNAMYRAGFNIRDQINNFLIGWDNYRHHNNPNSSSLIQRFEYWKTSVQIIRKHPLFGVGTGDVPDAFRKQYDATHSILDPKYRLRSHNQFLSITVALGIVGLIWFLIVLIYPMIPRKRYRDYFYMVFWLIFILSMLTEDTIESQEGVTFFACFTSLFLLAWDREDKELPAENQN